MEGQRASGVITKIGLLVAAVAAMSACGGASRVPFHMYSSPILESEMPVARAAPGAEDGVMAGAPDRAPDGGHSGTRVARAGGGPARAGGSRDAGSGADAPSAGSEEREVVTRSAPAPHPDDVERQSRERERARQEERREEEPARLPALSSRRSNTSGNASASGRDSTSGAAPSGKDESSDQSVEHASRATKSDRSRAEISAPAAQYIWAVYGYNGVEMSQASKTSIPKMYRECRERGKIYHTTRPVVGDIVFFHNVFDANDDGRNNDWYTLVGLVERIDETGTVTVMAYRGGRVEHFAMNLERPDAEAVAGADANTKLRAKRESDLPYTQYLSGQLFAGFCSMLGDDRDELVVVDNWQPGMELDAKKQ